MTSALGFFLFDTAAGRCGIAWGERGVAGIQLPEARDAATRARLAERFPDAVEAEPPPEARLAAEAICRLLRGEAADLDAVALDLDALPPFRRRVYEAARAIPPGATLSYGELAARIGAPGAARAVGQALGRNPFPIVVPCHRVFAAGGRVGGFTANGGIATKLRLLELEGTRRAGEAAFAGDGTPGFDPVAAVAALRAADPALARIVDRVGPLGLRLQRTSSLFAALAEAIVYQQLTGKAAATIFARVRALFPRAHDGLDPAKIVRAPDEKLRGAGLSRAKTLALRDLAARAVAGTLPSLADLHGMDDETVIERLVEVRGIGRWTAEMLLIFRLGRPDVLPLDDYGVRKGLGVVLRKRELPSRADLARRGERWRPYRTAASWYLWRAAELGSDHRS